MNRELLIIGNLAKDVILGEETRGGCAASIALNSSGLGIGVGVQAMIGKDAFSTDYRHFLEAQGVDMSLTENALKEIPVCHVTSVENTIFSSVWIDNDCHPAMEQMEINNEILQYNLVHLISCPPKLGSRVAEQRAHLSYEPGPMMVHSPEYFDPNINAMSDLLFFNDEEYSSAKEDQGYKRPEDFIGASSRILVVTHGSKGSSIYRNNKGNLEYISVPSVQAKKIVDHTGAGDCYKAGFIAGYLRNKDLEECGEIGSVLGAECVGQTGGILPLDSLERVRATYSL